MARRLAAVLSVDVVGYSRLMGADEAGTLAAIKAHRKELFEPKALQYHGRTVKLMGDGALMEFPSAVDAVAFAVEVQCAMAERNEGFPKARQIVYRIGINIGDIIIEDDDIFGDGVNIAARLEGLAEPGGICVARNVFDQVKGKLDLTFKALGRKKVKNITQPVTVYRLVLDDKARQLISEVPEAASARGGWRPYAAALLVLLLVAGGIVWWQPWASSMKPAPADTTSVEKASLPRAGKPVIAVLPFQNISGEREQDYFSDGITGDVITDLSQISGLFVIARSTMFTYKGNAVKVEQLARELGASFVLEGSVQKAGNRVRVNVQLVDARTRHPLWADRYDRELRDVFSLQDDVVQKIVGALSVKLRPSEEEKLSHSAEAHPEAYDMLLRGLELYRRLTPELIAASQEYFERAIAFDPSFARAHAALALSNAMMVELGIVKNPKPVALEALEIGKHALALDDSVREVHFALSIVYRALGRHDEAIAAARRAIALDPNYADGYGVLAINLNYAGKPEEGLAKIKQAMELNPRHPFFYVWILGQSYYLLGRYDEAAEQFERVKRANPHFPPAHKMLAVVYTELGRVDDAEWAATEYETLVPDYTLKREATSSPYREWAVFDRYVTALRKAGLQ
jgi:adenylate cyclase